MCPLYRMLVIKITLDGTVHKGATKHIATYGNWFVASFPGLPRFFVLRFAFSIVHGNGRVRKTGKAWEHLSRE